MRGNALLAVLVVLGVVVGSLPAAAASGLTVGVAGAGAGSASLAQANETQNNSSVNVSVGQQLSTVIAVTEEETESEVEGTAFSISVETENESERAEAVAERAEELREQAEDIREDYREATAAYEEGELTKSEYAQRLAVLNARAQKVLDAYERLRQVAGNVSTLELRAAGYKQANTSAAVSNLSTVSGAGASALLKRFTGETEGEVEIETKGGLSISVESEDGEQSREFERPRDGNRNFTVNQTAALETARGALSDTNGTWVLTKSRVHDEHGTYRFEFRLDANATEGEAEVVVDGSSGKIVKLEEEIADVDDEGDDEERSEERENESEDGELSLLVASGSPAPNETVTLQVLANGEPASNVTVRLNDEVVGTTGADGTVQVTLPASGDAELTAVRGEAEAELEFEFGEDEREEIRRNLNATGSVDNGTVTVSVTYNGTGVAGATVFANGEQVGTTDADGTLSFETNATEELELEIVKGEFEASLVFSVTEGSLTLTETDVKDGESEDESKDESDSESESESEDEQETETEEEKETETEDEEETDTSDTEDEQDSEDEETDSTETDSDD